MIFAIFWFVLVLIVDIETDFKRIGTGKIKHKKEAIIRSLFLLPTFLFLFFPLDDFSPLYILYKFIVVGGLIFSYWWKLFDGFLNIRRKKQWNFAGSDDNDDAKTDNFLQKYKPKVRFFIKLSLIILFTILYILL